MAYRPEERNKMSSLQTSLRPRHRRDVNPTSNKPLETVTPRQPLDDATLHDLATTESTVGFPGDHCNHLGVTENATGSLEQLYMAAKDEAELLEFKNYELMFKIQELELNQSKILNSLGGSLELMGKVDEDDGDGASANDGPITAFDADQSESFAFSASPRVGAADGHPINKQELISSLKEKQPQQRAWKAHKSPGKRRQSAALACSDDNGGHLAMVSPTPTCRDQREASEVFSGPHLAANKRTTWPEGEICRLGPMLSEGSINVPGGDAPDSKQQLQKQSLQRIIQLPNRTLGSGGGGLASLEDRQDDIKCNNKGASLSRADSIVANMAANSHNKPALGQLQLEEQQASPGNKMSAFSGEPQLKTSPSKTGVLAMADSAALALAGLQACRSLDAKAPTMECSSSRSPASSELSNPMAEESGPPEAGQVSKWPLEPVARLVSSADGAMETDWSRKPAERPQHGPAPRAAITLACELRDNHGASRRQLVQRHHHSQRDSSDESAISRPATVESGCKSGGSPVIGRPTGPIGAQLNGTNMVEGEHKHGDDTNMGQNRLLQAGGGMQLATTIRQLKNYEDGQVDGHRLHDGSPATGPTGAGSPGSSDEVDKDAESHGDRVDSMSSTIANQPDAVANVAQTMATPATTTSRSIMHLDAAGKLIEWSPPAPTQVNGLQTNNNEDGTTMIASTIQKPPASGGGGGGGAAAAAADGRPRDSSASAQSQANGLSGRHQTTAAHDDDHDVQISASGSSLVETYSSPLSQLSVSTNISSHSLEPAQRFNLARSTSSLIGSSDRWSSLSSLMSASSGPLKQPAAAGAGQSLSDRLKAGTSELSSPNTSHRKTPASSRQLPRQVQHQSRPENRAKSLTNLTSCGDGHKDAGDQPNRSGGCPSTADHDRPTAKANNGQLAPALAINGNTKRLQPIGSARIAMPVQRKTVSAAPVAISGSSVARLNRTNGKKPTTNGTASSANYLRTRSKSNLDHRHLATPRLASSVQNLHRSPVGLSHSSLAPTAANRAAATSLASSKNGSQPKTGASLSDEQPWVGQGRLKSRLPMGTRSKSTLELSSYGSGRSLVSDISGRPIEATPKSSTDSNGVRSLGYQAGARPAKPGPGATTTTDGRASWAFRSPSFANDGASFVTQIPTLISLSHACKSSSQWRASDRQPMATADQSKATEAQPADESRAALGLQDQPTSDAKTRHETGRQQRAHDPMTFSSTFQPDDFNDGADEMARTAGIGKQIEATSGLGDAICCGALSVDEDSKARSAAVLGEAMVPTRDGSEPGACQQHQTQLAANEPPSVEQPSPRCNDRGENCSQQDMDHEGEPRMRATDDGAGQSSSLLDCMQQPAGKRQTQQARPDSTATDSSLVLTDQAPKPGLPMGPPSSREPPGDKESLKAKPRIQAAQGVAVLPECQQCKSLQLKLKRLIDDQKQLNEQLMELEEMENDSRLLSQKLAQQVLLMERQIDSLRCKLQISNEMETRLRIQNQRLQVDVKQRQEMVQQLQSQLTELRSRVKALLRVQKQQVELQHREQLIGGAKRPSRQTNEVEEASGRQVASNSCSSSSSLEGPASRDLHAILLTDDTEAGEPNESGRAAGLQKRNSCSLSSSAGSDNGCDHSATISSSASDDDSAIDLFERRSGRLGLNEQCSSSSSSSSASSETTSAEASHEQVAGSVNQEHQELIDGTNDNDSSKESSSGSRRVSSLSCSSSSCDESDHHDHPSPRPGVPPASSLVDQSKNTNESSGTQKVSRGEESSATWPQQPTVSACLAGKQIVQRKRISTARILKGAQVQVIGSGANSLTGGTRGPAHGNQLAETDASAGANEASSLKPNGELESEQPQRPEQANKEADCDETSALAAGPIQTLETRLESGREDDVKPCNDKTLITAKYGDKSTPGKLKKSSLELALEGVDELERCASSSEVVRLLITSRQETFESPGQMANSTPLASAGGQEIEGHDMYGQSRDQSGVSSDTRNDNNCTKANEPAVTSSAPPPSGLSSSSSSSYHQDNAENSCPSAMISSLRNEIENLKLRLVQAQTLNDNLVSELRQSHGPKGQHYNNQARPQSMFVVGGRQQQHHGGQQSASESGNGISMGQHQHQQLSNASLKLQHDTIHINGLTASRWQPSQSLNDANGPPMNHDDQHNDENRPSQRLQSIGQQSGQQQQRRSIIYVNGGLQASVTTTHHHHHHHHQGSSPAEPTPTDQATTASNGYQIAPMVSPGGRTAEASWACSLSSSAAGVGFESRLDLVGRGGGGGAKEALHCYSGASSTNNCATNLPLGRSGSLSARRLLPPPPPPPAGSTGPATSTTNCNQLRPLATVSAANGQCNISNSDSSEELIEFLAFLLDKLHFHHSRTFEMANECQKLAMKSLLASYSQQLNLAHHNGAVMAGNQATWLASVQKHHHHHHHHQQLPQQLHMNNLKQAPRPVEADGQPLAKLGPLSSTTFTVPSPEYPSRVSVDGSSCPVRPPPRRRNLTGGNNNNVAAVAGPQDISPNTVAAHPAEPARTRARDAPVAGPESRHGHQNQPRALRSDSAGAELSSVVAPPSVAAKSGAKLVLEVAKQTLFSLVPMVNSSHVSGDVDARVDDTRDEDSLSASRRPRPAQRADISDGRSQVEIWATNSSNYSAGQSVAQTARPRVATFSTNYSRVLLNQHQANPATKQQLEANVARSATSGASSATIYATVNKSAASKQRQLARANDVVSVLAIDSTLSSQRLAVDGNCANQRLPETTFARAASQRPLPIVATGEYTNIQQMNQGQQAQGQVGFSVTSLEANNQRKLASTKDALSEEIERIRVHFNGQLLDLLTRQNWCESLITEKLRSINAKKQDNNLANYEQNTQPIHQYQQSVGNDHHLQNADQSNVRVGTQAAARGNANTLTNHGVSSETLTASKRFQFNHDDNQYLMVPKEQQQRHHPNQSRTTHLILQGATYGRLSAKSTNNTKSFC